jgi:hypothetical protein
MSRKSNKLQTVVTAPVAVKSTEAVVTVPVVETPIADLIVWDCLPEIENPMYIYPQPLDSSLTDLGLPEGTFYVRKPTRSQVKHDGNDLGRAVTLILQLLPLTDHPTMLPAEKEEIQQLLLRAAYMLETADVTPFSKTKINVA